MSTKPDKQDEERFVLLLDILGFKEMVKRESLSDIAAKVRGLLAECEEWAQGGERFSFDTIHFSDTVLLYTQEPGFYTEWFNDLVYIGSRVCCSMFANGIAVRGAGIHSVSRRSCRTCEVSRFQPVCCRSRVYAFSSRSSRFEEPLCACGCGYRWGSANMSSGGKLVFNPAPGWPKPPASWVPPKGWVPDPSWPPAPEGWQLWISDDSGRSERSASDSPTVRISIKTSDTNSEQRVAILEAENALLRARLEKSGTDVKHVVELNDERVLQHVGIYRYHHPLENAIAYKERLNSILALVAEKIKADVAIERSNMFTLDGSLGKGRKMTSDLAKLMLRAYNAEAENVVRSLRAGSVTIAIKRLEAARDAIAKLGTIMEMRISDEYHALRIKEVELTADYVMKKQEEREIAKEERERLREEQKVAAELAAERERLEKERSHLATVIEKLRLGGTSNSEFEQKLAQIDSAIAQNDYRAANIRAGYVYVISNRGAFGNHVVKIGLTRRLEPEERIYELGDASVPFRFDLHALYFSEDAVTLESDLHRHFASKRVNWVNDRREFFFATPAEVRTVLAAKVGNLLEFADEVESTEYLQSVANWPGNVR